MTPRQRRKLRVKLTHLRAWRHSRFWTQEELAMKAGISPNTVIRLEGEHGMANTPTFKGISRALGISVEQLLFETPPHSEQLEEISR